MKIPSKVFAEMTARFVIGETFSEVAIAISENILNSASLYDIITVS